MLTDAQVRNTMVNMVNILVIFPTRILPLPKFKLRRFQLLLDYEGNKVPTSFKTEFTQVKIAI